VAFKQGNVQVKGGKQVFKKVFVLVVILSIAAFAAACGGDDTPATTAAPATTATTAAPATTTSAPTATTEAVAPVTLKLQGAFPEGGAHYYYLETFQQKVEEYSGGTLKVVWGSGPEAIPANELAEALANDAVELVFTPYTYLVSFMPVMAGVKLLDAATCRTNGGYEYINEISEEGLNAHFLGRASDGVSFTISVNKEIKTLDDFKGLVIRGTAAHEPLMKALGASIVSMPLGDIYDALQRNVVDGAGSILTDIVDNSLQDVLKYLIQPGIYTSDSSLLIAMGAWNKLAPIQQEALSKAALDWEIDSKIHNTEIAADVIKTITDAGMQVITLEGAMRDTWVNTANDEVWKVVEAADPVIGPKLHSFAK
jgi:TRAP-type C4-dicarboxylate transport system substrate-binding protein